MSDAEASGVTPEAWRAACDRLARRGYVVIDDWLGGERVARLLARALGHRDAGRLRPAGLGRAGERVDARRRGDAIAWLEPPAAAQGCAADLDAATDAWLWQRLDALREALNAELWTGLVDFEAHYAWYPPGAHYEAHVDRLRHDDRRLISAVLYLNDAWDAERDGGALRLFVASDGDGAGPANAVAVHDGAVAADQVPCRAAVTAPDVVPLDIAPNGGRLVLFRSETQRHAVLPARRDRFSVAVWFRRRGAQPV